MHLKFTCRSPYLQDLRMRLYEETWSPLQRWPGDNEVLKWSGAQSDCCPQEEIWTQRDTPSAQTQRERCVKKAVHKPRREASGQTCPAAILTLDFQTAELGCHSGGLWGQPPSLGCFAWQPQQTDSEHGAPSSIHLLPTPSLLCARSLPFWTPSSFPRFVSSLLAATSLSFLIPCLFL